MHSVDNVRVAKIADDFTARQKEDRKDLVGKINAHPVIYWLNIVVVIAVITVMLAGWLDPARALCWVSGCCCR